MANASRTVRDYFGSRLYPGTGNLDDYLLAQDGYGTAPLPAQMPASRLGLSPQYSAGVGRYMDPAGGGFSFGAAQRLYQDELQQNALIEQEQSALNREAAVAALQNTDIGGPKFSQQAADIFRRYGADAVNPLKEILPLSEHLRRASEADKAAADPYLNKINDPRAFQSYRQRRAAGMAPEQAWADTLFEREEDDLTVQALESGIPLDEIQKLRNNGRLDRYRLLEGISSAKRSRAGKELGAEAYSRILGAEDELAAAKRAVDLSEDNKKAVFKKEFKRDPVSAEDWDRAYELANKDVRSAEDKFNRLRTAYSTQYRMPADLDPNTAPPQEVPAPQPTAAFAAPDVPVVPPVAPPPAPEVVPATPGTFEALSQQVEGQKIAKERKQIAEAQEAYDRDQKYIAETTPKWESAKQELIKKFTPDLLRFPVSEYKSVATFLGKKDNEEAFKDANGKPVSWGEVTMALMNDPRIRDLGRGTALPTVAVDPKKQALRDKYKY